MNLSIKRFYNFHLNKANKIIKNQPFEQYFYKILQKFTKHFHHSAYMNQLKVDVVNNNKSRNSFGNSFAFSDDPFGDNEFQNVTFDEVKDGKKNKNSVDFKNPSQLGGSKIKYSKQDQMAKSKVIQEEYEQQASKNSKKKKEKGRNNRKLYNEDGPNQELYVEEIRQKKKQTSKRQKDQQQQQQKSKNAKVADKKVKNNAKTQKVTEGQKSPAKASKNKKAYDDQYQQKPTKLQTKTQKIPQKHKIQSQINEKIDRSKEKSKNSFQKQENYHNVIKSDRNDKQNTKIFQIKNNITRLNSSLKDIKENYRQIQEVDKYQAADQILFRKKNKAKEMEIRQFLTKKRLQKQKRHKKLSEVRSKQEQQTYKTIEVAQLQKKREKQEKLQRMKQHNYIQPKQKRQRYRQSQQIGKQLASSVIQKYKNHEPVHIRRQKQFQHQMQKIKQEQEQILMQRKQRYQSLDIDELQEHKRMHEEKLEELQCIRKQQRQDELIKIHEDNILMKDHIWKGPSYDIVDEERLQIKRRKKQPKQKVKKMKNYYDYIKKNFLPKTLQPKKSTSIHDPRISQSLGTYAGRYSPPTQDQLAHYDSNRIQVKRHKFLNGKSIGQVIQSVPVARSYSQQKKIGQGYLQHLKNLPKKKQHSQSTTQIDPHDLDMINRKFNEITKVKRQAVPFYQNNSRKRTVSISLKPTKEQVKMVYEQLKYEDIKLKSKRQLIRALKQNSPGSYDFQKEVNNNMVLNMERKLDLLTKL